MSNLTNDSLTPEARQFPIGGDPAAFCVCGHHELNHANYAGMNRACNQTGCECRSYTLVGNNIVD